MAPRLAVALLLAGLAALGWLWVTSPAPAPPAATPEPGASRVTGPVARPSGPASHERTPVTPTDRTDDTDDVARFTVRSTSTDHPIPDAIVEVLAADGTTSRTVVTSDQGELAPDPSVQHGALVRKPGHAWRAALDLGPRVVRLPRVSPLEVRIANVPPEYRDHVRVEASMRYAHPLAATHRIGLTSLFQRVRALHHAKVVLGDRAVLPREIDAHVLVEIHATVAGQPTKKLWQKNVAAGVSRVEFDLGEAIASSPFHTLTTRVDAPDGWDVTAVEVFHEPSGRDRKMLRISDQPDRWRTDNLSAGSATVFVGLERGDTRLLWRSRPVQIEGPTETDAEIALHESARLELVGDVSSNWPIGRLPKTTSYRPVGDPEPSGKRYRVPWVDLRAEDDAPVPFAILWESANAATVYGLPAGSYRVECACRRSRSPVVGFTVSNELTTRVPIPMDPCAVLDVHVTAPDNRTGTLSIQSIGDRDASPILREITGDGVLTFGLAEGGYRLRADFGGYETEQTIEVAPGKNFVLLR